MPKSIDYVKISEKIKGNGKIFSKMFGGYRKSMYLCSVIG